MTEQVTAVTTDPKTGRIYVWFGKTNYEFNDWQHLREWSESAVRDVTSREGLQVMLMRQLAIRDADKVSEVVGRELTYDATKAAPLELKQREGGR